MPTTQTTTMDPEFKKFLTKLFTQQLPFNVYLGLQIGEMELGEVRIDLPYRKELIGNPILPALHGGVISALLDTAAGLAVWTQLEMGDLISTVDLRVDYLRPGKPELLFAKGRVVRQGNRVGVAEVRAFHEGGWDKPVAVGMGVYNIRRGQKSSSFFDQLID